MSFRSAFIEYVHSCELQNGDSESCAVFSLHDRDFLSPIRSENFPSSLCGLLLCDKGSLQITCGETQERITAMTILPIAPWRSFALHDAHGFNGKILLFAARRIDAGLMQTDYACDLLFHFLMHAVIPVGANEYDSLRKILRVLEHLSRLNPASASCVLATQHCMATILYIMHGAVREHGREGLKCNRNRQSELFCKFFHLLTLNYKRQRSVAYYAERMCFSPRYLSTVIKEVSGRSTTEWIDDFVMAEIQYQLRHTTRSIQQIAYDMG